MADGNGSMIVNAYDQGSKLTPKKVDALIRKQNMLLAAMLEERLQNATRAMKLDVYAMVKQMIESGMLGQALPPVESFVPAVQPTDPE